MPLALIVAAIGARSSRLSVTHALAFSALTACVRACLPSVCRVQVVIQYACALLGATVVNIDVRASFADVTKVLGEEEVRVLFMSPRVGSESRLAKLATAFQEELEPFTYKLSGYEPFESKRLRSFKFIVQTGAEPMDGVIRLRDLPVYGDGTWTRERVTL